MNFSNAFSKSSKSQLVESNPAGQSGTQPPPADNKILIDLHQVVKTYETPAGPFTALKNVDLQVNAGEFAAVIGKSGSGKSTLINMITGIDRPTLGEVLVDNTPIHKLNEDQMAMWRGRSLGVIFQFFQLLPTLTLLENVMLPMELCNTYPRAERAERAMYLLELVGLEDQAHKFPSAVSGGQQQRVAISRALANDPEVLVADEPTGSLDSKTSDSIFRLFEDFVNQGRTILMVTHDTDLSSRASRVIFIADGEITDQYVTQALPSLSKEEQVKVMSKLESVTYPPGSVIIRQGDPANEFYIIVRGEVEVVTHHPSGEEIVVGRLGEGQYFGEMGLMEGGTRTATVRATPDSNVVLMQLDRDSFSSLMRDSKMTNQGVAHLIRQRTMSLSMSQLGLEAEQLVDLESKYELLAYEPGEIIIRPGDPADKFFIVTQGQVEVVDHRPDGDDVIVARLTSGDYFGEMGLLRGGKRIQMVRAAAGEAVEVAVIDRQTFSDLIENSRLMKTELAKIVARRRIEVGLDGFMAGGGKRRKRQIPDLWADDA